MPKYVRQPVTWVGWLVQILIAAAIIGLFWSSPKILWFLPFGIAACIFEIRWRKRRLKAMAAARSGESVCTFARSFDCAATDTWVIRAVYEQLQSYLQSEVPTFPLRRDDNLVKQLGIDPEDLAVDLVDEIATTLECLRAPLSAPH